MSGELLEIENYSGSFRSPTGELTPVLHEVSYRLKEGALTAVVGETGSGKSLVALSVLGIQPPSFVRRSGRILFRGVDLLGLDEKAMRRIRGAEISMVFQDARAALNPVFTVGRQLADVYQLQHGGGRSAAMKQAVEALCAGFPFPSRRGGPGNIRTSSRAVWRSAR
jgi:ABC-type glutathione transport system ATPase component